MYRRRVSRNIICYQGRRAIADDGTICLFSMRLPYGLFPFELDMIVHGGSPNPGCRGGNRGQNCIILLFLLKNKLRATYIVIVAFCACVSLLLCVPSKTVRCCIIFNLSKIVRSRFGNLDHITIGCEARE